MAWTTPGTAVAGNVLTAAQWNSDVRDNSLMGNPVFTNEAARDAAIISPVEGQRVYLTAPTVPAGTGGATYLPTGIETIYNGTNWVCLTPVGAFTTNVGTTTSTTYTATLSGSPGTNPSVTLVTGTTALVQIRGYTACSAGSGAKAEISVAVSGATTLAANGQWVLYTSNNVSEQSHGTSFILSGLTAGTNVFTMQYRSSSGTGTFENRGIIVTGIS